MKLTNTLACRDLRGVLPASEPMVYLSGRALHPLAVRTALPVAKKPTATPTTASDQTMPHSVQPQGPPSAPSVTGV
mgnify:CR=1 FL=1